MEQKNITNIQDFARWGCYVASLASLAERHLGRPLGLEEFGRIYDDAVTAGFVLHNDIPVGQPGWYRCYVAAPTAFGNRMLRSLGLKLRLRALRYSTEPGPDFTLICYKTKWGHHFVLGDSNGREIVNPAPQLSLLSIDSYRVFQLEV